MVRQESEEELRNSMLEQIAHRYERIGKLKVLIMVSDLLIACKDHPEMFMVGVYELLRKEKYQ